MATNNNTNSNRIVVPQARQALDQMKLEIASELGMANYDSLDKGNLPSRQNGYVGGYMTRRMVEFAQQNMSNGAGTLPGTGTSNTPTGR